MRSARPLLLVLFAALFAAQPADAQIFDRLKEGAKRGAERAAEREAARRADAAVTDVFEAADDAVRCAVGDDVCVRQAESDGKPVVYVDRNGEPLPADQQPAGSAAGSNGGPAPGGAAPGEGVWANYDFVPGDRVLFYHDFEGTRTGNFPSRLDYIAGNLDVVELGDNKVLRVGEGTSEGGPGGNGCVTIPLPETLPERYTIEFRVRTSDPLTRANVQLFSDGSDDTPDTRCTYPPKPHVFVGRHEQGLQLPGAAKSTGNAGLTVNEWMDVAITVDGDYWKMYVDGTRIANVPKYEFPRAPALHLFLNVYRYSLFVDDLRIAEGGPRSLYDDLDADGFVATTGILFDFGQATIKPESTPTLNEVVGMLEDHGDLRLRIEGHTDNVGSDDANRALSERRADAVRQHLVARGVDGGRLTTAGLGEDRPRSSNDTDEGRAENRRVEFHRL